MSPLEQEGPPQKERPKIIQKTLDACDEVRNKAIRAAKHGIRLAEVFGKKIEKNKRVTYPVIGSALLTAGILFAGNPDNYLGTTAPEIMNDSHSSNNENDGEYDEQAEKEAEEKRTAELIRQNRSLDGFKKIFNSSLQNFGIRNENVQLIEQVQNENIKITPLSALGTKYEWYSDQDKNGVSSADYLYVHDFDSKTLEGFSQVRFKADANNKLVESGQQILLTDDEVLQRKNTMFRSTANDKEWKQDSEGNYVLERVNYSSDPKGNLEVRTKLYVYKNGVVVTSRSLNKMTDPVPQNKTNAHDEDE